MQTPRQGSSCGHRIIHCPLQQRLDRRIGLQNLVEKSKFRFPLQSEPIECAARVGSGKMTVVERRAIQRRTNLARFGQVIQIHAGAPLRFALRGSPPQNQLRIQGLRANEPHSAGLEVRLIGMAERIGIVNHRTRLGVRTDHVEAHTEQRDGPLRAVPDYHRIRQGWTQRLVRFASQQKIQRRGERRRTRANQFDIRHAAGLDLHQQFYDCRRQ